MTFAKTLIAGAALAGSTLAAMAVPTAASAQAYGYAPDPCRTERTQRGIIGGLLGAGAGVAFGHNITGRDDRSTGRVLGGLAGAAIGAGVGANTGACAPGYLGSYPAPHRGYAQPTYGYGQPSYGYSQPSYGYAQPSYGYSQPSYSYSQPHYGSVPAYGYSDPYSYRGHAGTSYSSYESRSYSSSYPSHSYSSYSYSQPVYSAYGY
jgi:hypothetical protein